MSDIKKSTTNETEIFPACLKAREELIDNYKLVEIIAHEYFKATEKPEAFNHLMQCSKCKEWFNEIIPPRVLKRQKQMARYCCASMYCAVMEHEESKLPKIEFSLNRDNDPCWIISFKSTYISYCPWCGKKLPNAPF